MDTACALVGIDVSKKKLDVAMLVSGKIKVKVVENTAERHKSLLVWLSKSSVPMSSRHVCMEATGVYSEPVRTPVQVALSSREVFKWLPDTPPHTLTDLQRAARFFYLQQHAFGGKVDGQSWGTATTAPPLNLLRIEENLSAAHLRLSGAYIENLD